VTALVTVSPSANPVCSGTGVVYTATAVNAGSAPVYTWRVNGSIRTGATAAFNYTPSQGDVISASVTAGGTLPNCLINSTATSSGVTALVNGTISTSISIGTSSTTVCQGSSVNFIATASGTGSAPVYAWYVNSVKQPSTSSTFSYVPSQGDVVRATMTPGGSGTTCVLGGTASSAGVSLSVLGLQTASVAVQASATTLCAGNLASFTATSLNSGTSPFYTWHVNGAIQSSGNTFSYNPATGDQVVARLLVGGALPACLTTSTAVSSPVEITVNALNTPSISIAASATSLCSGTGVVLTATGVNAGTLPSISWIKNNSVVATGANFSFNPVDGEVISARLTVGGNLPGCLTTATATSNVVSFSVSVCLKPQVSAITGPAIVLDGAQDVIYSVPNVSGDTYQ
ncbi:MAG: hypothetical protein K2Q22_17040, partial [Cytophagales bacterium]|nr:hypothetical protein [Cytophagales bacterium]